MTITHDEAAGWVEHSGEPRWRATGAAFRRLAGARIVWTTGGLARVASTVDADGRTVANVATLRHVPAHRRWIVRIEGFEFHEDDRIMGDARWKSVHGENRVADARRFVEAILAQSGATVVAGARKPS